MTNSIVSLISTRFIGSAILPREEGDGYPTDRQELLSNYNQQRRRRLEEILVGAGGIGGELGMCEVRKGVGKLVILDHDLVNITNLNRQRFYPEDLYKNKAECLGKNLAKEATSNCIITAYPVQFQDAVEMGLHINGDVVVCGVDNNEARVAVSRYFLQTVPVIFIAVSEDADHGYVFVQEPGEACYGCIFPEAVGDLTQHPCSPSIIDILKVVAGVATYAVDTLIMDRKRNWNYKEIFLSGVVPERNTLIEKGHDCPICGSRRK